MNSLCFLIFEIIDKNKCDNFTKIPISNFCNVINDNQYRW